MDTSDLTPSERLFIEVAIANAKLHGCDCEPFRIAWEQVQAEWEWLSPRAREAAEQIGPDGIFIDHDMSCHIRRAGAAWTN